MKRIPVLLTLVAVLALAGWIGDARPAYAMPNCADLNGHACVPPGQLSCWRPDGSIGGCACTTLPGSSPAWFCF